jgi:hypothetical protein
MAARWSSSGCSGWPETGPVPGKWVENHGKSMLNPPNSWVPGDVSNSGVLMSQRHQGQSTNQPMIRWWFGAPLGFCQEWRPRISTNWARKSTPVPYNRGWLGIPVPTISIHFQPCSIKSTVPTITRKWLWRPLESLEKSWRGRKM